ncbi:MAG: hypothetical protein ACI9OJ_004295, partial [Myxococcota bacterium]
MAAASPEFQLTLMGGRCYFPTVLGAVYPEPNLWRDMYLRDPIYLSGKYG